MQFALFAITLVLAIVATRASPDFEDPRPLGLEEGLKARTLRSASEERTENELIEFYSGRTLFDYSNCHGYLWQDRVADGICDGYLDIPECDYDGGDCCPWTCDSSVTLYPCGANGYNCTNPSWKKCGNFWLSEERVGDGLCDGPLNRPECHYDGGDCCPFECVDGPVYECGANGFNCTHNQFPDCNGYLWEERVGDGLCDNYLNKAECGYDGGDCCSWTCLNNIYECGVQGYNCTIPQYPECTGYLWEERIGDALCDQYLNTPECGYDDGDCCPHECVDGPIYTCGANGYNCTNPLWKHCDLYEAANRVGDGLCDAPLNIPKCNYDGGDCCYETCTDDIYNCGVQGYNCTQPMYNRRFMTEYHKALDGLSASTTDSPMSVSWTTILSFAGMVVVAVAAVVAYRSRTSAEV